MVADGLAAVVGTDFPAPKPELASFVTTVERRMLSHRLVDDRCDLCVQVQTIWTCIPRWDWLDFNIFVMCYSMNWNAALLDMVEPLCQPGQLGVRVSARRYVQPMGI